jgi:hypothetical protein
MKLPNAGKAFVDLAKLRDYSLSTTHEEGKHKARVFFAALDLEAGDAVWLQEQLLRAAITEECELGRRSEFGQRYTIDFTLKREGRAARIRSGWIVRTGETFPRLVTCYVL